MRRIQHLREKNPDECGDEAYRRDLRGLDRDDLVAVERLFYRTLRRGDRDTARELREWARRKWTHSSPVDKDTIKWVNLWRRMGEVIPTENPGNGGAVSNPDESLRAMSRLAKTGDDAALKKLIASVDRAPTPEAVEILRATMASLMKTFMDASRAGDHKTAQTFSGTSMRAHLAYSKYAPKKSNPSDDEERRRLERLAKSGDLAAAHRLERMRVRRGEGPRVIPYGTLPPLDEFVAHVEAHQRAFPIKVEIASDGEQDVAQLLVHALEFEVIEESYHRIGLTLDWLNVIRRGRLWTTNAGISFLRPIVPPTHFGLSETDSTRALRPYGVVLTLDSPRSLHAFLSKLIYFWRYWEGAQQEMNANAMEIAALALQLGGYRWGP